MTRTLQSEGILHDDLFPVDGELVEHYNRALMLKTGKQTGLTEFRVDKRGESPEIEEELGQNYLQTEAAHRFMIAVSPNQRSTRLIHPEFSFDDRVIDFLYEQFFPQISLVTRVDGMVGELDDGVRTYHTVEDLLLLHHVHVELHTESYFLRKARRLQAAVDNLRQHPNLLTHDDAAYVKAMCGLIVEVGDVQGYNLSPVSLTKEVGSFYTRLFDGAYVFRAGGGTIGIHRPGTKPKLPVNPVPDRDVDKTVVFYGDETQTPDEGPNAIFFPLSNVQEVVGYLILSGYARFSPELADKRLDQLDDQRLLGLSYPVSHMNRAERTRALTDTREHVQESYIELRKLRVALAKGTQFSEAINHASPEVQAMLLEPVKAPGNPAHVVTNLLTKLVPFDYAGLYRHNTRDLEHVFGAADNNTKDYIAHVIHDDIKERVHGELRQAQR